MSSVSSFFASPTTWLIGIVGAVIIGAFAGWRFGPEQIPDPRDIGRAVAISKEPVVADAVLASGKYVDQEPGDEL